MGTRLSGFYTAPLKGFDKKRSREKRDRKQERGCGFKGDIEISFFFFFERDDIKECLYATGSEKLQRMTHIT